MINKPTIIQSTWFASEQELNYSVRSTVYSDKLSSATEGEKWNWRVGDLGARWVGRVDR